MQTQPTNNGCGSDTAIPTRDSAGIGASSVRETVLAAGTCTPTLEACAISTPIIDTAHLVRGAECIQQQGLETPITGLTTITDTQPDQPITRPWSYSYHNGVVHATDLDGFVHRYKISPPTEHRDWTRVWYDVLNGLPVDPVEARVVTHRFLSEVAADHARKLSHIHEQNPPRYESLGFCVTEAAKAARDGKSEVGNRICDRIARAVQVYETDGDSYALASAVTSILRYSSQTEAQGLDYFVPETISAMTTKIGEAADAAKHAANAVNQTVRETSSKVDAAMDSLITMLTNVVPSSLLTQVLQTICLLYRLFQCYQTPSAGAVACTVVELLILLKIPEKGFSTALNWVMAASKLKNAEGENEAFHDAQPEGPVAPISMLFSLLGLVFCTGIPLAGTLESAVKYARAFGVFATTAEMVSEPLTAFCNKLPNCFRSWFLAACPMGALQEAVIKGDYDRWVRSVESTQLLSFVEQLSHNEKSQELVVQNYELGLVYHTALVNGKMNNGNVFAHVERMFNLARSTMKLGESMKGQNSWRARPFYVALTGPPGTSKTTVGLFVAKALAPKDIDPNNLLYIKNPGDPFFSGIRTGVFGIMFDDLGQDAEGKSILEAIYVNNNAPYLPNMPSLESGPAGMGKGMPISCKLFLATSNASHVQTNAVTCQGAEHRRRDIVWRISIKPEYADAEGMYDPVKTPDEVSRVCGHMTWQRIHKMRNEEIGKPMSTMEALVLMRGMYKVHVERQIKLLHAYATVDIQSMMDAFEAQGPTVAPESVPIIEMTATDEEVTPPRISAAEWVQFQTWLSLQTAIPAPIPTLDPEVVDAHVTTWCQLKGTAGLLLKYGQWIAIGIGMLLGGAAIGSYFGSSEDCPLPQGGGMVSGSQVQRVHNKPATVMATAQVAALPQSSSESMEYITARDIIKRNQVLIGKVLPDGREVSAGPGLALCGNLVTTNYHALLDDTGTVLPEGTEMTITYREAGELKKIRWKLKHTDFSVSMAADGPRDLAWISYPKSFRSFKDITSRFLTAEEHGQSHTASASLLVWCVARELELQLPRVETVKHGGNYAVGEVEFHQHAGYKYAATTERGFCGAPLVYTAGPYPGKILGVHRAGSKKTGFFQTPTGYSEPISREDVMAAREHFKTIDGAFKGDAEPQGPWRQTATLIGYGKVPLGRRCHLPTKTSLKQSPIWGVVADATNEPAALTSSDPRLLVEGSPYYRSLEKNGRTWHFDESPEYVSIMQSIRDELLAPSSEGCIRRVLTEHEAINGIDGVNFVDRMEMSTSAGYPYKITAPGKGKGHLFTKQGEDYSVENAELRYNTSTMWAAWHRRQTVEDYIVDTLKDELRPIPKVQAGKTRTINVCSTHFTINFRRLFLGFQAYLMQNREKTSVALGMDPMKEWDKMVEYLSQVGGDYTAGDYEKFDASMLGQMFQEYAEIANAWYNDDEASQDARRSAMYQLQHAMHIAIDTLVLWDHANASGNPATTLLNILFNMYCLRRAWFDLAPIDMRNMMSYSHNVRLKALGDDNILRASSKAKWFNLQSIAKALAVYGIVYTSPDKEDTTIESGPLQQWTFLKFGFRRDQAIAVGLWLPTMSRITIESMTNWIRRGEDDWTACQNNCADALNFAFFHGHEYFEEMRCKIAEAFRVQGCPFTPVFPNWVDLRTRFLDGRAQVWCEPQSDSGTAVAERPHTSDPIASSTTKADDPTKVMTTQVQKGSEERKLGVITTQQTTVETVTRTDKDTIQVRRVKSYMPDIQWSLTDTARKTAFFKVLDWDISLGVYAPLVETGTAVQAIYDAPHELLSDATQSLGWNAYAFARPALKVTFRLQGHKFAAGLIKVCYWPGLYKAMAPTTLRETADQLPGAFMSACTSGTSAIVIPFTNIQGWIRTKLTEKLRCDTIGLLQVLVLERLTVPVGSPTKVQVMVTVELVETNFRVLAPSTLPTLADAVEVEAQGGLMDLIPGVGPIVKAVTGVAKKLGEVADVVVPAISGPIADLDNPSIAVNDIPLTLRMPRMNHLTGLAFPEKLTFSGAHQRISDDETFGTKEDEARISSVCKRWGYDTTLTWDIASLPGSILWATPVCPLPRALRQVLEGFGLIDHPSPYYHATYVNNIVPVDFCAIPYRFWAGSMRFRLIVCSSVFHTGQIMVCYYPNTVTIPANTQNQRTARWFQTFELNAGTQEFEFALPYTSTTPVKNVPNGRTTTTSLDSFGTNPLTYCSGIMTISVFTQLQAPASAVNSVKIRVLRCGGDDFRVMHPTISNRSLLIARDRDAEPESDGGSEMANLKGPVAKDGVARMAPVQAAYDAATRFGEYEDSMVKQCRRYALVWADQVMTSSSISRVWSSNIATFLATFDDSVPGTDTSPERYYNLFHHWTALFRYMHGGLRFRAVFQFGANATPTANVLPAHITIRAFYIPMQWTQTEGTWEIQLAGVNGTDPALKNIHSLAQDITISSGMMHLDFEIPFDTIFECLYTPMTWLKGSGVTLEDPEYNLGKLAFVVSCHDAATTVAFQVYMATSDEFSVGGFIGTPPIYIRSTQPDGYTAQSDSGAPMDYLGFDGPNEDEIREFHAMRARLALAFSEEREREEHAHEPDEGYESEPQSDSGRQFSGWRTAEEEQEITAFLHDAHEEDLKLIRNARFPRDQWSDTHWRLKNPRQIRQMKDLWEELNPWIGKISENWFAWEASMATAGIPILVYWTWMGVFGSEGLVHAHL